jgi:dTDP-4-amino-4,6-dideoxygalactose transaminase
MSKLARDGGTPVRTKGWPHWPASDAEAWKKAEGVFREVFLSGTEGLPHPRGRQFCQAYRDFLGAKHALLTTSGSSALKLALGAVTDTDGLGYNGECLVPAYTFIACATMPLEMGFSVRFVDADPENACMDPAALEAAITDKTRVIMPVDILGHPADMDTITAIARKHNLKIVEDACQAHGAAYKGRRCGTMGDAGCFSFQSTKNLCCGEGGVVATNSDDVSDRAYALHNVGRGWPDGPGVGYNYRASEYLAALLEHRLKDLPDQMRRRDRAAAYLTRELKGITGIQPWKVGDYVTQHAWHLYPMRYSPSAFGGRSRDEFIQAISAEGISISTGYGAPLAKHDCITAVRRRHPELISDTPCPNTERICAESLWFTQNILLAEEKDLADIVEAVRKIQKAFHA